MSENTKDEPKEYTDEEKREIEAQIRANHPEYNGVLDQMGELREKLQVVDKRRFAENINPALDLTTRILSSVDGDMPIAGSPTFSPSSNPNKPIGMDFSAAIQEVRKGNRVTKVEWGNPDTWLMMFMWTNINPKTPAGKYLTIHHADGAMHPLYISDGDLAGDDWVVVV